jgi:hypothetical protein
VPWRNRSSGHRLLDDACMKALLFFRRFREILPTAHRLYIAQPKTTRMHSPQHFARLQESLHLPLRTIRVSYSASGTQATAWFGGNTKNLKMVASKSSHPQNFTSRKPDAAKKESQQLRFRAYILSTIERSLSFSSTCCLFTGTEARA